MSCPADADATSVLGRAGWVANSGTDPYPHGVQWPPDSCFSLIQEQVEEHILALVAFFVLVLLEDIKQHCREGHAHGHTLLPPGDK